MLNHARQLDMKDVADNPHPGVPRVDIKSSRNGFASPSRGTKPGALRSWHRQCLQLGSMMINDQCALCGPISEESNIKY